MALVAYSDSEGSENEAPASPKPVTSKTNDGPRKIKVDLPTVQPEPSNGDASEQPPAKRARTTGAFGGFNSFLPAPKRPATPQGLKKGVNLKTSSEAAFSRAVPVATATDVNTETGDGAYDEFGNPRATEASRPTKTDEVKTENQSVEEVKIVGKATRFKPLSVANNNKKKVVKKAKPVAVLEAAVDVTKGGLETQAPTERGEAAPLPHGRPKKSLFSVPQEEEESAVEPIMDPGAATVAREQPVFDHPVEPSMSSATPSANSLEAVAADLNLTSAQRRQLFGRSGGKNVPASIAHFNMDSEYAANEQIRQSGEAAEHRAVKSIAPGKHSLQQLVNNARSNQDSIEDKWAEGRRNQGGGNYGWTK